MVLGLVVFVLTYLLIAGRRLQWLPIDRPAGALIGAVLAVAVGVVTPAHALAAVDGPTILLLFSIFGIGAYLTVDGFFERAAEWLARAARSRARLLGILVWSAGLLAAVVTNDAVCVFGAPIVVAWIQRYGLPRKPFLLALATASNTGSVGTLVGNPQNMLCASLGDLGFASYAWRLAPVTFVALALNHAFLAWVYRRDLSGTLEHAPGPAPSDAVFTWRSRTILAVLAATMVAYFAGLDLAWSATGGFVVLMLILRVDIGEVWARLDWSILLFFAALFVAVEGVRDSGVAGWAFDHVPLEGGEGGLLETLRTAAIFLVGANVVTNVPFILLVEPEIAGLAEPRRGWELLAMASTFAGNLTLLGSVANVIVAEKAHAVGGLGFREHLRIGAPLALACTALGAVWLWFLA